MLVSVALMCLCLMAPPATALSANTPPPPGERLLDDPLRDRPFVEEHDEGQIAARRLAVEEPPPWYRYVVGGTVVLFLLAATLGSIAVLTKGPEPADEPHHDDHGHGSHH